MSKDTRADAVIIGAGPGGYPAGIRLGQLGLETVVVEREYAGGVCLNVGCIPSKSLIHAAKLYEKLGHSAELGIMVAEPPTVDMRAMQEWKGGVVNKLTSGVKQLLKANGAELVMGTARIERGGADGHRVVVTTQNGGAGGERVITTKNVVVATGSRPIEIPGFAIDQKRVIDSTGALALTEVPGRMVVIGGGYIGLELGTVYAKLGSKVTVLEAMDSVLSGMDPDCVKAVARKLKKMGVEVMLGAKAKGWEEKDGRAVVTVEVGEGKTATVDADVVLLSVGRRPNSENLGLKELGVKIDKRGFIEVDKKMRTNVAGVYAIGDVAGGMLLAHKATKEGEVVAEVIAGHKAAFDARTIPAVVFTDPEVASTGMTEKEARDAGYEVKIGKFPFAALGRALSVNDTDGFAKIIADAATDEILGLHLCGNGVADLISEGALAIEMGAVLRDVSLTIHPHPTLSESLMEAAAAALKEAIHVVNR
jgi:dihydrolipoamide dehydrogenase